MSEYSKYSDTYDDGDNYDGDDDGDNDDNYDDDDCALPSTTITGE